MIKKLTRRSYMGLGVATLALLAYFLVSRLWWSSDADLRVIDATSRRPIAGAIVLANWELTYREEYLLGHVAVYEGVTGADGAMTIPGWAPRFRLSGVVRADQPTVNIFHRGYLPVIVHNTSTGLWNRLLRVLILQPSVDGRTIELQPFHGSLADYSMALREFRRSIDYVYAGPDCEWRAAPRTLVAMDKLKSDLQGAGDALEFASLDSFVDSLRCGSMDALREDAQRPPETYVRHGSR